MKDLMSKEHYCFKIHTFLTLPALIPDKEKKMNLNFYFHTSLWCIKRFYEGLKGLHKTFCGTTKKCESKNSSYRKCMGWEGLIKRDSYQIFKKGGLDRTSTLRRGLLKKRGVTFFRGGCNFYKKNKLKSEIFNDKKSS